MCFNKYSPTEIAEEIKEERSNFYEGLGKAIGIGQPSEAVELKESWNIKEVLTIVYIVVDDAYKKLFGNHSMIKFFSLENADTLWP
jgi:hypothetical protein